MNETKLREMAANVSLELGLMGMGADKIYGALKSVRDQCAVVASMYTVKPGASIHPDIPFEKMNEIAKTAAHTTAQHIAAAIRELT